MKKLLTLTMLALTFASVAFSQKKQTPKTATAPAPLVADANNYFKALKWRCIGPYRGGRSVAATGVVGQPYVYYMGSTGGGVWKTTDMGISWENVSDGYFGTGSVGAIAVAASDPNVIYVGMGEHAPRGVMTSYGDGVYKSTDAGKTWKKIGLELSRHISDIQIHPTNPDLVYVAAQGTLYGPNKERGIYRSTDGGATWKKIWEIDENTGCADLSMDPNNPRILYAAMWDYQRKPWEIRSGGKGSGLYKSTDSGETWIHLEKGLPAELGKMGISVSKANSNKVYAVIESDSQKEKGGVFASNDGGASWARVSTDHNTVQRAWYYTEITADPTDENTVYLLNVRLLKSIDGGKTWDNISIAHGDTHDLWINPADGNNMILADDGGAAITINGGISWSSQNNQPTAQFYRINTDNLFPYSLYAGQQDNSSLRISHRNTSWYGITEKDWTYSAGGESAFLAFDPNNPRFVMGGSYQGNIEILDVQSGESKPVMEAPIQYLAMEPKNMKYRFNWNAPIIWSKHEAGTFYHGAQVLLKTTDMGRTWTEISPDLTRNDKSKQGLSGVPFTNEGAGGENYGTLAYVVESPHEKGVIWTGSDDGLIHLTTDGGNSWANVTPPGLDETLINCIEVSAHSKGTVYVATTRYKFNDLSPSIYKTKDYGRSWTKISAGLPDGAFTRVVREDTQRPGLLFAGTETGLFVSYNDGGQWQPLQLNLPVCPITDLKVHQGDLLAATSGRSFWILDDLGAIRQYDLPQSKAAFQLLQPEDIYRVSGRSELDANGSDDNYKSGRIGRMGATGTNPASGAVIYYQVPAKLDSNAILSLEITNNEGQVIRSFSSKALGKDPALPLNPGLNRFVWDLRYPNIPEVEKVHIEGNFDGRRVPPGRYLLSMSLGTDIQKTAFTLLPDPRINATADDYAQQAALLKAVEEKIALIHQTVKHLRKVRAQLDELVQLIGEAADKKAVIDAAKALSEKITQWEEKLIQPKSQSYDDVINFENKLTANYLMIKSDLDVNTPYVTAAQKQRLEELNAEWQKHKTTLDNSIQNELNAFNELCKQMNVGSVVMPAGSNG